MRKNLNASSRPRDPEASHDSLSCVRLLSPLSGHVYHVKGPNTMASKLGGGRGADTAPTLHSWACSHALAEHILKELCYKPSPRLKWKRDTVPSVSENVEKPNSHTVLVGVWILIIAWGNCLLMAQHTSIYTTKSTLGKYLGDITYMFTKGHLQDCNNNHHNRFKQEASQMSNSNKKDK